MFSDQNATPHGIHIRNQHQILSIMDTLEYLISKKIFWSLTPFPGGLRGPQVKKFFFAIKQKNHLTVCIRLC